MLKKIIVALVIIVIILIAGVTIALYNSDKLIAKFKPQIEEMASKALGEKVEIKNIDFHIFPASLCLKSFKVGSSNNSSPDNLSPNNSLLSLEQVDVALKLLPLISKKIEIRSIDIIRPEISVARSNKGITIKGLENLGKQTNRIVEDKNKNLTANNEPAKTSDQNLNLNVDQIKITNGKVNFSDEISDANLALTNLNLDVSISIQNALIDIKKIIFNSNIVNTKSNDNISDKLSLTGSNLQFNSDKLEIKINENVDLNIPGIDLVNNGTVSILEKNFNLKNKSNIKNVSEVVNFIKKYFIQYIPPNLRTYLDSPISGSINIELAGTGSLDNPDILGDVKLNSINATKDDIGISDLNSPINVNYTSQKRNLNIGKTTAKITKKGLLNEPLSLELPSALVNLGSKTNSILQLSFQKLVVNALNELIELNLDADLKEMKGTFKVVSDSFKLSSLSTFSPAIKDFSVSGAVSPNIKGNFSKNAYSADGSIKLLNISSNVSGNQISDLNGIIDLTSPNKENINIISKDVTFNLNKSPVKVATSAVYTAPNEINVTNLIINAFSGTISAKAKLILDALKPLSSNYQISDVNISELLKGLNIDLASRVKGTLKNISGSVTTSLGGNIINSLNGNTKVTILDTVFKDVNIAKQVLSKIDQLPFLNEPLINKVPPEYQDLLKSSDTQIDSMTGDFGIQNGVLLVNKSVTSTPLFKLEADGKVKLENKDLDLNSTLYFNKSFSQSLVQRVKELKNVLNGNDELVVPVTIFGIPPKVIVTPNLKKLLEVGAQKVIQDKSEKLIGDLLGGKGKKGLNDLFKGF